MAANSNSSSCRAATGSTHCVAVASAFRLKIAEKKRYNVLENKNKTQSKGDLMRIAIVGCVFWLAAISAAQAEIGRHAIVIAVSDYEILPAKDDPDASAPFDLEGPKHDALEMIRLAGDIGVPRRNLVVLADSIDRSLFDARTMGLPTRRRILRELDMLARRVKPTDQVLVYFSGHGSYQPDQATPEAGKDEADGVDEILLPIDIGDWDDDGGTVENAITDDEFGQRIEALRERGAYVWVIVDACHSGTALRGSALPDDDELEYRSVTPAALGIPADALRRSSQDEPTVRGTAAGSAGSLVATENMIDGVGEVTAFYAATASEVAVGGRWKRPDGSLTEPMGLLTFTIRQGLAAGRVGTYHDLALRVSATFDIEGRRAPVPAFEGSMNRAIFGHEAVAPIRWPIERRGKGWVVRAGLLDGLREAAILEITPAYSDSGEAKAYVRVGEMQATSATLVPIDYNDLTASAMQNLSKYDPYVGTVVESGIPFTVTVARPPTVEGASPSARKIQAAIDHLSAAVDEKLDLRVEWVPHDAAADLYLIAGDDRLWFGESPLKADTNGRSQPPWMRVSEDANVPMLAAELAARLAAFARARTLLRVMGELELGQAAGAAFNVDLFLDPASQRHEQGIWPESERCKSPASIPRSIPRSAIPLAGADVGLSPTVALRHCDVVYARVSNLSDQPVDFTPLYFDREYGITYLESGRRDGIRIMPGKSREFFVQINTYDHAGKRPYPVGVEQLVIVGVVQPSDQVPTTDYSYLVLKPSPPDRSAGRETSLDRLLDAAGFGIGVAGRSLSVASGEAAAIRFGLAVTAD
jgi:hypothetical protein